MLPEYLLAETFKLFACLIPRSCIGVIYQLKMNGFVDSVWYKHMQTFNLDNEEILGAA
jgi:hypothetical protein